MFKYILLIFNNSVLVVLLCFACLTWSNLTFQLISIIDATNKKSRQKHFSWNVRESFWLINTLSLCMTRWWLKNFQPRSFSRQFKRCLSILLDSNTPGTIAFLCEAFFLCLNVTPHLISIDWCYPQINKQTQLRESWTSTIIVAISRMNQQSYHFLNFWIFIGLFRYVRKFVKLKLPSLHKGQHQPQYFNH